MRRLYWILAATALLIPFQNCGAPFKSALNTTISSSTSDATDGAGGVGSGGGSAITASLPPSVQDLGVQSKFEDTFTSLDGIARGPTGDGTQKWFNGVKQCCMSDESGKLPAVMYPTVYNGVQIDPYAAMPGGGLKIGLIKKNGVWESGILTSVDQNLQGFKQKYGYFEIRAKMPKGKGVWPAFWMLSTDPAMGGEIDIFEYYGVSEGKWFGITLHDWRDASKRQNITEPQNFPKVSGLTDDFHTFGLLWTEETLTFYFEGEVVWTHPTPDVMKHPYFMLVNNGLGGGWPTDETPAESYIEVQYIRAYALP